MKGKIFACVAIFGFTGMVHAAKSCKIQLTNNGDGNKEWYINIPINNQPEIVIELRLIPKNPADLPRIFSDDEHVDIDDDDYVRDGCDILSYYVQVFKNGCSKKVENLLLWLMRHKGDECWRIYPNEGME